MSKEDRISLTRRRTVYHITYAQHRRTQLLCLGFTVTAGEEDLDIRAFRLELRQQLARAQAHDLARPFDRIEPGWTAAAVCVHLPAALADSARVITNKE